MVSLHINAFLYKYTKCHETLNSTSAQGGGHAMHVTCVALLSSVKKKKL